MSNPTDRREAIEAAFEAAEQATTTEAPQGATPAAEAPPPSEETTESAELQKEAPAEVTEPAPKEVPAEVTTPTETFDKPPQSWKAAEKAKWGELDIGVRQEVMRRERQVTQVLNESAQARGFVNEFVQTVQPYMARIQAIGHQPLQAVNELLKADYILSSAPAPQRAKFMAQLIQDYAIDIQQLDAALSGQTSTVDPTQAKLDELLEQRLAPLNQFIQTQRQQAEAVAEQNRASALTEVQKMAADTENYPYFAQVRESMADWIEFAQKKNMHIDLKTAYNKAVMSDPELSRLVATQQQATVQAAQAQRARNASVSVSGAPRGVPAGSPPATDRRAIIAQAFDNVLSR